MKLLIPLSLLLLATKANSDESFNVPLREQGIIVSKEGFYPKSFSVFRGEKLRIFLTSTEKKPGCLLLPDFDVFMSAGIGKITEKEVYFHKAGTYEFYCPAGKMKGRITVLERPEDKLKKRKVASEQIDYWMPKGN